MLERTGVVAAATMAPGSHDGHDSGKTTKDSTTFTKMTITGRARTRAVWLTIPAVLGIALVLASQVTGAQVRPGQFSWQVTIPYTERIFQGPIRSYVELDAVPLSLLISNEFSEPALVNLRDVRAKLAVRIDPVMSQIEWPANFALRRDGSLKPLRL